MKYSETEDIFLKENFKFLSLQEMALNLGRTLNSVRNRCHRLGFVDTSNYWTDEQIAILKDAYQKSSFSCEINLDDLASSIGKLKSNVCRKARFLGLTDQGREKKPLEERRIRKPKFSCAQERNKATGERISKFIKESGHPKGMLGKAHSEEFKKKLSVMTKERNSLMTEEQLMQRTIKSLKTRYKNNNLNPRSNTTWKSGWREIGGCSKYYRSRWEANYARYLEFLKNNGDIKDWKHEPKVFWFEGVKRGCVSYLPDFVVIENNDSESYHEVKGWMDDKSKTKIKRMAKYHPQVRLIVIQEKQYNEIKKKLSSLILGWE